MYRESEDYVEKLPAEVLAQLEISGWERGRFLSVDALKASLSAIGVSYNENSLRFLSLFAGLKIPRIHGSGLLWWMKSSRRCTIRTDLPHILKEELQPGVSLLDLEEIEGLLSELRGFGIDLALVGIVWDDGGGSELPSELYVSDKGGIVCLADYRLLLYGYHWVDGIAKLIKGGDPIDTVILDDSLTQLDW